MTELWFQARRYGWGWKPVTVEGWLVVVVYLAVLGAITGVFLYQLRHGADPRRAAFYFVLAVATLAGLLIAIGWLTGERPRWRWGGE